MAKRLSAIASLPFKAELVLTGAAFRLAGRVGGAAAVMALLDTHAALADSVTGGKCVGGSGASQFFCKKLGLVDVSSAIPYGTGVLGAVAIGYGGVQFWQNHKSRELSDHVGTGVGLLGGSVLLGITDLISNLNTSG
jgi:hypothetical protein